MSMTASAENMTARKNSMAGEYALQTLHTRVYSQSEISQQVHDFGNLGFLGSWWFGSTSSANADSNYLRVNNPFTSRRLSDNTLITPKIRIGASCSSSPGGTPGSGLPIRRHSSTLPSQERRGSNTNLSPPTVRTFT